MKPRYLTVLLLVLLTAAAAPPAGAVEPDKRAHFLGAAALGAGIDTLFYHFSDSMGPAARGAASAGLAVIPGLGVEIADHYSNHGFSWSDLGADAIGAVTGALVGELVNGQFWISASGRQVRLIGHW